MHFIKACFIQTTSLLASYFFVDVALQTQCEIMGSNGNCVNVDAMSRTGRSCCRASSRLVGVCGSPMYGTQHSCSDAGWQSGIRLFLISYIKSVFFIFHSLKWYN